MRNSVLDPRVAARALGASLFLLLLPSAHAVPSFARQTGMACEACHTVFPELTHFGRTFKANGYTLDNLKQVRGITAAKEEMLDLSQTPPISIMIQAGYTAIAKSVPDSQGAGNAQNGGVAFPQQVSLFYAGKIAPHVGAFLQLTYAHDAGTIEIDNVDVRYANNVVLGNNTNLVYGVSLNNNPTVQDLWNSTPAFGFPSFASDAAPTPGFSTQIDGVQGQQVAGLSAYLYWNEALYAEVGVYRSAKQGVALPLDSTSAYVIDGVAPYWRLAYEHQWGRHSLEAGVYGAIFDQFPGAAAPTPTPLNGATDRARDIAVDFQYQFIADQHLFTFAGTGIRESQTLTASSQLGAANASNDLTTLRFWGTYYFRRKIGATVEYFSTTGSVDPLLYPDSPTNSPDSEGWMAEVNYVPWLNTKFSLQYTLYNKFDGSSTNYDGTGRNAKDNNALFAGFWFSY